MYLHDKAKKNSPTSVGYPSLISVADADPDCELHFPWMIEDDGERIRAMRWWMAGYQTGFDTAHQGVAEAIVEFSKDLPPHLAKDLLEFLEG